MKNRGSLIALLLIATLLIATRFNYISNNSKNGYNATSWDALGYYMYLPSAFIYDDFKTLEWVQDIDSTYQVTGGELYQATQLESGTYTNKYLIGVAVLEAPGFFVGHLIASYTESPTDGFSWPYQYALLWWAIIWAFFGFMILRKVLLEYFSDYTTAMTLLFLAFTMNFLQYISIDGAMSHSFIFPLYALLLWFTVQWVKTPNSKWSFLIGLVIGLAVISRPTELIMIFIPLLWKMENGTKWQKIKSNYWLILAVFCGGIIAISPQLIYWYHTTGNLIHNVGSKWYFLNPWFRVLIGPEKGWFIYTPIALLMVLGFWKMKQFPFKSSVITFCLLNIWIIISWSDWKYGASYSTRALTHSYPVFALALGAFIHSFERKKLNKWLLAVLLIGATILNFYQMKLYNLGMGESYSPIVGLFN